MGEPPSRPSTPTSGGDRRVGSAAGRGLPVGHDGPATRCPAASATCSTRPPRAPTPWWFPVEVGEPIRRRGPIDRACRRDRRDRRGGAVAQHRGLGEIAAPTPGAVGGNGTHRCGPTDRRRKHQPETWRGTRTEAPARCVTTRRPPVGRPRRGDTTRCGTRALDVTVSAWPFGEGQPGTGHLRGVHHGVRSRRETSGRASASWRPPGPVWARTSWVGAERR